MRKTLLLVFIHGFQGGDNTFGTFPEHLRALVSHALPDIDVVAVTYPKFETRGELKDCVTRFRECGPTRLQNKVIDLEVARSTPSPTVDPSVHVILIGHSMGGIVAVETYLLLASEQPIHPTSSRKYPERPTFHSTTTPNSTTSTSHPTRSHDHDTSESNNFMFPHVQGILAFDTPFLGLAPGMVAYGLEGGHKVFSNAYSTYNDVASLFGWGSKSEPNVASASASSKAIGALPAPTSATADAAATPKWQSWGKYAMFAGAAGAVVAGGAAALYSQREKISAGLQWASDHLLFVNELFRPEYLRQRIESIEEMCKDHGAGCANLYTNLGKGAREGYGITASVAGKERTFCNLPVHVSKDSKEVRDGKGNGFRWVKAINDKAVDETTAHISMFIPRDNPGFYTLGEQAKECITAWIDQGWYRASNGPTFLGKDHSISFAKVDDGWEKPDYDAEEIKGNERERDRYGRYQYPDADIEGNLARDWASVDLHQGRDGIDSGDDDDVKMRDHGYEGEDLEDSVIVEKGAKGEVPLPKSRPNSGLYSNGITKFCESSIEAECSGERKR
ncbi:uncharacterized protein Z518_02890 [Rhinocladiella mackenziei CBS 650.93]|uniref:AB hydrolase-1 domain-containing protein n=1 Tax=Rhinocladiella mackenziei CBS 650.93 TaxID=1442369 RepID=A0A0D2IQK5_9EURO|nr:uncharacterized protein Z518_02890 [Rhinocladiella mackenziei CBS 650.93]KIX08234.1 hypothetical protein Z518_02890 [Rhinocladiella mackenziei CBS 650.93]